MGIHPSAANSLPATALEACEAIIHSERSYRIERSIAVSEVKVFDRLLRRRLELGDAYEEVFSKLNDRHQALKVFFEQLASTAAFWNPQANTKARKDKGTLVEVNRLIEASASELAKLLAKRTQLCNDSGFSCGTHYHPIDVLHAAAQSNSEYRYSVQEPLEALTARFDLRYWPSLPEFAQAIAEDAAKADPQATHTWTEAGTGSRAALVGTFNTWFVALEDSSRRRFGFLPNDFELTDRSAASLMSCALDLEPDDVVDSTYVKGLRQRQRGKRAATPAS